MTVFKFNVFYDGDRIPIRQKFVVAENEDQAWDKILHYEDCLIRKGCKPFSGISSPIVFIEHVI